MYCRRARAGGGADVDVGEGKEEVIWFMACISMDVGIDRLKFISAGLHCFWPLPGTPGKRKR